MDQNSVPQPVNTVMQSFDSIPSSAAPPVHPLPVVPAAGPSQAYATFIRRGCASLIDLTIYGLIVFILTAAVSLVLGMSFNASYGDITKQANASQSAYTSLGFTIFGVLFLIMFLVGILNWVLVAVKGQSPGKMILGIKIIKKDTHQTPGFLSAFLREAIGRLINGSFFSIGYLWMLWDADKQTVGDKIAGTIVIKL